LLESAAASMRGVITESGLWDHRTSPVLVERTFDGDPKK